MDISRRLRQITQMVTPGMILADIGTDHAYVPAFLLLEGKISSAIAMDLREGPLDHAAQTLHAYHLESKVQLRLSDGLAALVPGEAECAVIAGMGGELIVRILEKDKEAALSLKELILGPQSELEKVRSYLRKNGWIIADEEMIEEDGKYYPLLKVKHLNGERQSCPVRQQRLEDLYGPVLLRRKHRVLVDYLRWEQGILLRNQERLQNASSESGLRRREEIGEKLALNRQALKICTD